MLQRLKDWWFCYWMGHFKPRWHEGGPYNCLACGRLIKERRTK